jgi:hypothetical protein
MITAEKPAEQAYSQPHSPTAPGPYNKSMQKYGFRQKSGRHSSRIKKQDPTGPWTLLQWQVPLKVGLEGGYAGRISMTNTVASCTGAQLQPLHIYATAMRLLPKQ